VRSEVVLYCMYSQGVQEYPTDSTKRQTILVGRIWVRTALWNTFWRKYRIVGKMRKQTQAAT